ncbi:MAG: hypothetical protein H0T47_17270 [Planctomycetaceae bacterium]|nr:hypothetical protein [Planctomycetaceae bacterium]
MAMGGRAITVMMLAAAVCGLASRVEAAEPAVRHVSHATAGHVVMPHPNACVGCDDEKGWCAELWEKFRPGHRDRYVTRQNTRHLNHPECPPWCMENFGHYQTCWRRFPEHTLGCRYCDVGSPPPPAAPIPAMPLPVMAPPAPPSLPPAELQPIPPMNDDFPPLEPETVKSHPVITPTSGVARWKDPEWKAGLRSR